MANRNKADADKELPSNQEWIAGGAKNPDDFDSDDADKPAAQGGPAQKQKREKPGKHQA